ncbi:DUF3800 domain-containing protein [Sulfitobacter sp. F26169L]|uniref:DUF3800 domain-containing protein n=1 Tax=Sulfitobacter sp. F26169L TaxID=2996015 RepID=UPI002260C8C9|nr:DUF3800 domain-containing protein [Sulfitobacter sp. F26169L]MCX7566815.1 DUF3800 domain-containing protein [Sulfitobacter sp. F26169L]
MKNSNYHYILYIDEAGDDKTHDLKPKNPNGNSEWLCLGGYLIRYEAMATLDDRRDCIYKSFGGQTGSPLHFRKHKPWNRLKIAKALGNHSARAFVVCSFKKTMVGHKNHRAAAAGTASSNRQYLYNFVARLLLERVSEFVTNDAEKQGIPDPKIKIVMASRRGHHFGHFKAYVLQLIRQAMAKTTFLNAKEINPQLFAYSLIARFPASSLAGLQLADAVVSATFQSIERSSPNYHDKPARLLRKIIAGKRRWPNGPILRNNVGLTVFPVKNSHRYLDEDQKAFFSEFGYDFNWLKENER